MATRGRKKSIATIEAEGTNSENSVLTEFVDEMKNVTIGEIKASMPTNEPMELKDGDETSRDNGFVLDNKDDVHNDEITIIELTNEEVVANYAKENNFVTVEDNSADVIMKEINTGNEGNKDETTNTQTEEQKMIKDAKPKRKTTREVFGSDVFGVVYGY